jgi:hypothetical protein
MYKEQRIRAVLFYLSVAVFFIGLPMILSSALGLKFDRRTFKFTKTGIIFLKTQPLGASIYLDDRLLEEKTPLTLNEMLPGRYRVKIVLKDHYQWSAEINVESGKVSRFDKIILFPERSNIKQINKQWPASFWFNEKNNSIYYLDREDNCIYNTDPEGEAHERIACLPPGQLGLPVKWALSPDKEKILCYGPRQAAVFYPQAGDDLSGRYEPFMLDFTYAGIRQMYWHSDSYHLIAVTENKIVVLEARPNSAAVTLVNLNKKDAVTYYNSESDTLYFSDMQQAADGNLYENIYKLELNNRVFAFRDFMKQRQMDYESKD